MKMHVLSGGRLRMNKSIYLPGYGAGETIDLPVPCALLRHPQGNVLFDTGCHPTLATDARARLGVMLDYFQPIFEPGDHVLRGLEAVGLAPNDIDLIVNSHFHSDHCGCNEFLPSATFLVHARELAAVRAPGADQRGYLRVDWDHPVAFDTIAGERDIFGDGRLVLTELPGHTPGSIGMLAALDRTGLFVLAADALPLRATLDLNHTPANTPDPDKFHRSLAELRRLERQGATLICGHDTGQWTSLRKGTAFYD